MRKTIVLGTALILILACKENKKEVSEEVAKTATESTAAKAATGDWEVLFNGDSFDGWHEFKKEGISEHWKLEEGAMVFHPPKDRPKREQYNLVTDKEFTDFILSLEWRIAENGNSGVMYGVKELDDLRQPYETGPEIQVLDNEGHPDAKNGTSHQAGALYDMVSPTTDVTKPIGEWNSMQITINHKTNEGNVVLNGQKIVEFPVNDPEWSTMVADSKFSDWEYFSKYPTGKIALQDHGDEVSFRNIKIKQL
jgi:hypothetical protein